jgi:cobalamin biosynthesis protein CobD/CbiB
MVFIMGDKMPRPRKKQESLSSWVFLIALAILVLWIIKMLLKIDPPFEDLLANVPWIAVAFGAGALYAKVALISKDVDEISDDLKEVRDSVNQIKGRLKIT